MVRRVFVYIYEGFADFESVFTTTFMRETAEVVTVSSDGESRTAESGLKIIADLLTQDVQLKPDDIFFIPGGDYKAALSDKRLASLLEKLNTNGNNIIAICGGVNILAAAGVLKGRRCTGWATGIDLEDPQAIEYYRKAKVLNKGIVKDGNIITATGQSYLELGCDIEMWFAGTTKEQMRQDYKFWKNKDSEWEKELYS